MTYNDKPQFRRFRIDPHTWMWVKWAALNRNVPPQTIAGAALAYCVRQLESGDDDLLQELDDAASSWKVAQSQRMSRIRRGT